MKNNVVYLKQLLVVSCIAIFVSACGQNSKAAEVKQKEVNMEKVTKTEEQWKAELTPEEFRILRDKGTEPAHTGDLLHNKEKGIYTCAGCGNELFSDSMKFNSGTGWPSFDDELLGGKIKKHIDKSHGMTRTEITCARCDGHLGHLFYDGSTATQQRYCVNSASLDFVSKQKKDKKKIILGGGCFWCIEASFQELEGVSKVVSGYSGGDVKNPTYREISFGTTGHAEVVEVTYDPNVISLTEILEVFFVVHDPTTKNRQGADVGSQYRSVIFYEDEEQRKIAQDVIDSLNRPSILNWQVVTELAPAKVFYKAETEHQNYYNDNKDKPYCKLVIQPKIEKIQKVFKSKLKK